MGRFPDLHLLYEDPDIYHLIGNIKTLYTQTYHIYVYVIVIYFGNKR